MPRAEQAADPRVLTVGRINLDLYVEEQGVPIREATRFVASVGGSPTNIAIVARRLGVPAALLSAEGGDLVGGLVRARLAEHGVDTRWLQTVPDGATSMALLSTPAPDRGERQFYRHRPADAMLDVDVVGSLPWDSLEVVVLSGDALAQGASAQTVRVLAAEAARRGVEVWWDLDLRPSSWEAPERYAQAVRPALAGADVVIGTEEELGVLLGVDDPERLVEVVRGLDLPLVVLKLGPRGAMLIRDGRDDAGVPALSASPVSTVGGGDTVAGTLVAGRLLGLGWERALGLAMTAAAWTVEQPYCSTGFPTAEQVGLDAVLRRVAVP